MTAAVIGLGACVVVLGILVIGLLRAHAEVLRVLHAQGVDLSGEPARQDLPLPVARSGLPPVDGPGRFVAATDIAGVTLEDTDAVLGVSGPGTHLLLAFLSSGCHTCAAFWGSRPDGLDGVEVVVVTKGPEHEVPGELTRLAHPEVPALMSTQAWRDYEVPVSPYFVHVLGGQVVGTGAATSWSQVVGLVRASLDGGLRSASTGHTGGRVEPRTAQDRAAHVDAELAAAGIRPGDPRLWPGGAV